MKEEPTQESYGKTFAEKLTELLDQFESSLISMSELQDKVFVLTISEIPSHNLPED